MPNPVTQIVAQDFLVPTRHHGGEYVYLLFGTYDALAVQNSIL